MPFRLIWDESTKNVLWLPESLSERGGRLE
jgi:hypothetical protein